MPSEMELGEYQREGEWEAEMLSGPGQDTTGEGKGAASHHWREGSKNSQESQVIKIRHTGCQLHRG